MSNRTVPQRGYALSQANRPTERAALRNLSQTPPAPAPDLLALFEGVLNSHATGDQRGLSLYGHAIARVNGPGKASA